jgi:hypothetical protein
MNEVAAETKALEDQKDENRKRKIAAWNGTANDDDNAEDAAAKKEKLEDGSAKVVVEESSSADVTADIPAPEKPVGPIDTQYKKVINGIWMTIWLLTLYLFCS